MTTINVGENNFYCFVTDVSGNAVTGLTTPGISGECFVAGSEISVNIIEQTGSIQDGLYALTINPTQPGNGYLTIKTAITTYDVSPDLYIFDVNNYDNDDVYQLIQIQNAEEDQVNSGGNYDRISEVVKEGDTYIREFSISAANIRADTPDISGYTNWQFTAWDQGSATTSGGSVLFSDDAIVVVDDGSDATDTVALVEVTVNQIPLTIIPEGSNKRKVYCDLSATNTSGNKITVKNVEMTISRSFR